ncbi:uncharacterized protein CLUP02_03863 [Colletotrichum lupini]|uniref:Uncharacterized protein n=1 Tax=Colletotrichum lupini TaxID=145971 RepID=A0A9Q8SK49_9PEZI|nr:uncharacterized protein CLUP02_03863 [Colletotrichum lupini]UQC78386.1 hypothetical protein CLUP02_03863 [Colletotrichum lupini]
MSSSLARTRSLRKPTQGSSTDLPPTTATSVSSSASITAARGPASSTTGGAAAAPSASASTSHRPVSPSRLPAPRSLAATRPTTRTVSGASVASSTAAAATTASEAPKKKRPNPLSSLLSRSSSTRQPASVTTSISTRQRDVVAGAGAGGGLASSGPISAPLSRTSALSGLTRTTSTREPGLTRTRYPANASTSNLSLVSETDDLGRSTILETRRCTNDDFDRSSSNSGRSWESNKGPRARKERRDPEQQHRPPTPKPDVVYRGHWRRTEITPDVPIRRTSDVFLPILDSIHDHKTPSPLSNRPPLLETVPTTAPPHLARQQAQQRHPSPTSPPRTTKPVLRPAFSTLQQHYSPAKSLAPKPLTATYLAAPSPSKLPANIALTAETSRLQTELLQLHLLHRDLPQVTSQWHASARSKLAARHADLAASARSLAALESDAAERRNLAALSSWGASAGKSGKAVTSSLPLEDRVQRLDALLTSLWSLDDPGGKHHRLVRAFERWASSLADLEAARARAEDGADPSALLDDNADVRFGGGLDARWKDDAAALVRRLEGWDAQLRELEYRGDDDEDAAASTTTTQASSLKRMLDGCSSLVRDMLDELAVMEEIEAAAVERENEWIKKMNREGDDGRGRDTQRAGAIWRVI